MTFTKSQRDSLCLKHCSRFICTLVKGHSGPHGRSYRRDDADHSKAKSPTVESI